jgi:hypothetical protein
LDESYSDDGTEDRSVAFSFGDDPLEYLRGGEGVAIALQSDHHRPDPRLTASPFQRAQEHFVPAGSDFGVKLSVFDRDNQEGRPCPGVPDRHGTKGTLAGGDCALVLEIA